MTTVAAATSSQSSDTSAILQSYLQRQKETQAATQAENTANKSSSSATKLSGDFSTFLKILTTQLQNQDPTNAQDTNAFTQQLVEFASVEQQINTNSKLDQLINQSKSSGVTSLLNYVGKYVEVPADKNLLLQDGSAQLTYKVNESLTGVQFKVTDSTGVTIASFNGPFTRGEQFSVWDGKLANGQKLSDGAYKLSATGTKADGTTVDLSNSIRLVGRVDSIKSNTDGTTTLGLGKLSVKESNILAVRDVQS
jgi:flagellar basal-body rod modification protein FlgD